MLVLTANKTKMLRPEQTFAAQIGRYADAPRSVRQRKPLIGSKSKVAEQYEAAAKELLERLEG